MAEEGIAVSKRAIYSLIEKFKKMDLVVDLPKTPRPRILSEEHYRFIDDAMANQKDLTAHQLHVLFVAKYPTIEHYTTNLV